MEEAWRNFMFDQLRSQPSTRQLTSWSLAALQHSFTVVLAVPKRIIVTILFAPSLTAIWATSAIGFDLENWNFLDRATFARLQVIRKDGETWLGQAETVLDRAPAGARPRAAPP
jgi:hypothetical protein